MRRLVMAAVAVALLAGSVQAKTVSPRDKVRAWRQAHEQQIYADFTKLLAMPNVAPK